MVTMQFLTALNTPKNIYPILREVLEIVEAAFRLKKSDEVNNAPAELVQVGETTMTELLTKIYDITRRTEE